MAFGIPLKDIFYASTICFTYRIKIYPKLTEKKFPFVLRDKTAWATDPFPIITKTSVPAKIDEIKMQNLNFNSKDQQKEIFAKSILLGQCQLSLRITFCCYFQVQCFNISYLEIRLEIPSGIYCEFWNYCSIDLHVLAFWQLEFHIGQITFLVTIMFLKHWPIILLFIATKHNKY